MVKVNNHSIENLLLSEK